MNVKEVPPPPPPGRIDDDAVSKKQNVTGASTVAGGTFTFSLSKHVALEPGIPLTIKFALYGEGKKVSALPCREGTPWKVERAFTRKTRP